MKPIWIITLLLFCGFAGTRLHATESFDAPITVNDIVFASPMTIVNRSQAEEVRKRIRAGREPQASAHQALLKDANAALGFTSNPPTELNIMGGYQRGSNLADIRALMDRETDAAYATALAWLYSGEAKYADKSVQVLRAWTKQGTKLGGYDAGLQIGSYFNRMLYAADILKDYDGWTSDDRNAFEAWWRQQALPHTLRVMRTRVNNWQDAALLGVLTAAVVFEDRTLLQEGLEVLDGYFRARSGNVNWKFRNDEKGVYIPKEVNRNDGGIGRGIVYTGYSLTTMVQAMEIARYCGYDWWQRKAANGATMKGLIEYYYRWDERGEKFPWHKAPIRRGPKEFRKNPYEFANNYYHGAIKGLSEFLVEHRPVDGRQGDPYITLNQGDMFNVHWMPKGLLKIDNPEVNYIAARGANALYLAFMNESFEAITATVRVDPKHVPNQALALRTVSDTGSATTVGTDGTFQISIPAKGLVAVSLDGARVTPAFQQKVRGVEKANIWTSDRIDFEEPRGRAVIMNFGTLAKSAYVYLFDGQADFEQVTLIYNADGTEQRVTKRSFPWEFTIPIDIHTKHFEFHFETTSKQALDSYRFTAARASSVLGAYSADKAIDGVISDASRWVSARDQEGPSWLELTLPEPKEIGRIAVASGYQDRSPVKDFVLQYKRGGEWHEIASTRVTDNRSTLVEIQIPENERVTADTLRFVFPHDAGEIIRIKEISITGEDSSDRTRTSPTYRLER